MSVIVDGLEQAIFYLKHDNPARQDATIALELVIQELDSFSQYTEAGKLTSLYSLIKDPRQSLEDIINSLQEFLDEIAQYESDYGTIENPVREPPPISAPMTDIADEDGEVVTATTPPTQNPAFVPIDNDVPLDKDDQSSFFVTVPRLSSSVPRNTDPAGPERVHKPEPVITVEAKYTPDTSSVPDNETFTFNFEDMLDDEDMGAKPEDEDVKSEDAKTTQTIKPPAFFMPEPKQKAPSPTKEDIARRVASLSISLTSFNILETANSLQQCEIDFTQVRCNSYAETIQEVINELMENDEVNLIEMEKKLNSVFRNALGMTSQYSDQDDMQDIDESDDFFDDNEELTSTPLSFYDQIIEYVTQKILYVTDTTTEFKLQISDALQDIYLSFFKNKDDKNSLDSVKDEVNDFRGPSATFFFVVLTVVTLITMMISVYILSENDVLEIQVAHLTENNQKISVEEPDGQSESEKVSSEPVKEISSEDKTNETEEVQDIPVDNADNDEIEQPEEVVAEEVAVNTDNDKVEEPQETVIDEPLTTDDTDSKEIEVPSEMAKAEALEPTIVNDTDNIVVDEPVVTDTDTPTEEMGLKNTATSNEPEIDPDYFRKLQYYAVEVIGTPQIQPHEPHIKESNAVINSEDISSNTVSNSSQKEVKTARSTTQHVKYTKRVVPARQIAKHTQTRSRKKNKKSMNVRKALACTSQNVFFSPKTNSVSMIMRIANSRTSVTVYGVKPNDDGYCVFASGKNKNRPVSPQCFTSTKPGMKKATTNCPLWKLRRATTWQG